MKFTERYKETVYNVEVVNNSTILFTVFISLTANDVLDLRTETNRV
jgi:hypothetical protein